MKATGHPWSIYPRNGIDGIFYVPLNATGEQSVNFGNCCILARHAHTSISDVCRKANSQCFSAALF